MNRRVFLTQIGRLALWTGLAGAGLPLWAAEPTGSVSDALADLVDEHFARYAQGRTAQELLASLRRKGVVSAAGTLDHKRIRELAQQETPVLYDGFYYTPTELEVYALAWLSQSRSGLTISGEAGHRHNSVASVAVTPQ